MSRLFALSDIHGHTNAARLLLKAAAYSPEEDRLFLLGDYINYEPDTWSSLDYIQELTVQGAVALAGNMERYMGQELRGRSILDEQSTVRLRFLESMPLYALEGPWLLVHAGIRLGIPLEQQKEADLIGIREEFWGSDKAPPYQVVFGHTPTRKLGAKPGELWIGTNRLGIDTGAKHGLRLTLVDLTGGKAYSCSTNPKALDKGITIKERILEGAK